MHAHVGMMLALHGASQSRNTSIKGEALGAAKAEANE